jgi:hypothetical protein
LGDLNGSLAAEALTAMTSSDNAMAMNDNRRCWSERAEHMSDGFSFGDMLILVAKFLGALIVVEDSAELAILRCVWKLM